MSTAQRATPTQHELAEVLALAAPAPLLRLAELIAAEEARSRTALEENERRLERLRQDLLYAEQVSRDASSAEERLGREDAGLAASLDGHDSSTVGLVEAYLKARSGGAA